MMNNKAMEVALSEFPFVQELPKREQKKIKTVWDVLADYKAMWDTHGVLVPVSAAAKLLNVSPQRILQLVEAGKLKRVDMWDKAHITEASIVELAESERKTGRPFKVGPMTWKIASETTKELTRQK